MRPCMRIPLILVAILAVFAVPARADDRIEIFDAHLHYNSEPTPFYSLDKVLEIFKRNNVAGILATSRPNTGTHVLRDAKAPGLWVVPFIRPYRVRSDIQTWFDDPAIYELVQSEYRRGYYRPGVGAAVGLGILGGAALGAAAAAPYYGYGGDPCLRQQQVIDAWGNAQWTYVRVC